MPAAVSRIQAALPIAALGSIQLVGSSSQFEDVDRLGRAVGNRDTYRVLEFGRDEIDCHHRNSIVGDVEDVWRMGFAEPTALALVAVNPDLHVMHPFLSRDK
jgi:hypothetical protein